MSREEMKDRIMTMFAGFPQEIQEAIATGAQLGQLIQRNDKPQAEKPAD